VTARERSLPIDRLFPFGRGLRGGGFISTQLQGGRGARLAVDLDFAPLNPGYSLRDADLPRQRRMNMPRRGSNTTVSVWRTRYRLRSAA
jgi:hypothetical protein